MITPPAIRIDKGVILNNGLLSSARQAYQFYANQLEIGGVFSFHRNIKAAGHNIRIDINKDFTYDFISGNVRISEDVEEVEVLEKIYPLYIRHWNGLIYEYFIDNRDPILIGNMKSAPDANIATYNSLNLAVKGDSYYTVVDYKIYKQVIGTTSWSQIGTTTLDTPLEIVCIQDDEYIWINGQNTAGTTLQFQKFNLDTNIIDLTIDWTGNVGSPYATRVIVDRLFRIFAYYDGAQQLDFRIGSVYDNSILYQESNSNQYAYSNHTSAYLNTVMYTKYDVTASSGFEFHILDKDGISLGIVTVPEDDFIPGADYANYEIGAIAFIGSHFIIYTVAKNNFGFYSVYPLTYTIDEFGNVTTVAESRTLKKTTLVYNEYNFAYGWTHAQTS